MNRCRLGARFEVDRLREGRRRPPHAAVVWSPRTAAAGRAANVVARSSAVANASSLSLCTSPIRSARSASIGRPASSNSNAAPSPISRGSNQLAPISGKRPILMNGGNRAIVGDPTRMSQASASDIPAPTAGPSMAAIVGCGNAQSKSTTRICRASNSATSASDRCERYSSAAKSAPELNAPLAPVRITASRRNQFLRAPIREPAE